MDSVIEKIDNILSKDLKYEVTQVNNPSDNIVFIFGIKSDLIKSIILIELKEKLLYLKFKMIQTLDNEPVLDLENVDFQKMNELNSLLKIGSLYITTNEKQSTLTFKSILCVDEVTSENTIGEFIKLSLAQGFKIVSKLREKEEHL
jgi:hypothetical protein